MDGVLMQQSNFDVELIISNDCSPDKTNEIIEKRIRDYNGTVRIKYFSREKNLGMQPNFIFALNQCSGTFIALCEGDDYWTDPLKLQKQVDYISKKDDCNMVFTDIKIWNENKSEFLPNWANIEREKYEFKDLIKRNVITTCTVLFRNPHQNAEISDYLVNFKIGDYPLYLFLIRSGYACFLNEVTAIYRQHGGGVFSLTGSENVIDAHINVLQTIMEFNWSKKELTFVRHSLVKWYYSKVVRMSSELQFSKIRPYIKRNLKWRDILYNYNYFFRIYLLYFFPKWKSGVFK